MTSRPILLYRPLLLVGIPVLRAKLRFIAVMPRSVFQLKPPLFMVFLLVFQLDNNPMQPWLRRGFYLFSVLVRAVLRPYQTVFYTSRLLLLDIVFVQKGLELFRRPDTFDDIIIVGNNAELVLLTVDCHQHLVTVAIIDLETVFLDGF